MNRIRDSTRFPLVTHPVVTRYVIIVYCIVVCSSIINSYWRLL